MATLTLQSSQTQPDSGSIELPNLLWSEIAALGPRLSRQSILDKYPRYPFNSAEDMMSCATSYNDEFKRRDAFVKRFSWAVPSQAAIDAIHSFVDSAQVVEINAGRGLWTHLLEQAGVNIIATDVTPPKLTFAAVRPLEATAAVQKYLEPGGVLMTCWPDYLASYAADALKWALENNRCTKVVYIGEGNGGCTGDDELHNIFETQFELSHYIRIPQWYGIRDDLYLYQKR